MLPQDAFLRNMPRALDLKDRLRLEAIVTSSDIIELAYSRLCRVLSDLAITSNTSAVQFLARVDITTHCWTIIDHLHNVRVLTKHIQGEGQAFSSFGATNEHTTLMRNAMDHLNGRIDNMSESKGSKLPLHGCISFAVRNEGGFEWVQFPLGAPHHVQQHFAVIDTWQDAPSDEIGHVNLAAFNWQLDLSFALDELRVALLSLNADIEESVTTQARKVAEETGIALEKVLAERVRGAFMFRFHRQDPGLSV